MDQLFQQFLIQARTVWRWRWYALAVAWVVCLVGWAYVHTLPERYEASARVYVDTQSLLQPLLRGLAVRPDTEQQVRMMTRTLLTRPNLEKVARMTDLHLGATTDAEMDRLVSGLSRNIQMSGGDRDNLYRIRYQHQDPETARRVVQATLDVFLESRLGDSRRDLVSTGQFIDAQIDEYAKRLERADRAVEDFKREHVGLMPGQAGNYYSRLEQAGQRLEQARLELREARNRRDTFQRQLAGDEPVLFGDPTMGQDPGAQAAYRNPELDSRINQLKSNLDNLRRRYTDEHPDIVHTQRIIEELEEEREEARQQAEAEYQERMSRAQAEGRSGFRQQQALTQNPYHQQLNFAVAEAESRVASLETRVEELEARYERLNSAVDRIPRIESEFSKLVRDRDRIRSRYNELLQRRESLAMTGELETRGEGVDIRVIEPPRVPPDPAAPDRPVLASAVLVGGLGSGVGFGFVLGQLRRTVDARTTLRDLGGRPILGAVTLVRTAREKLKRRAGLAVYAVLAFALLGAYGAVVAYHSVLAGMA